MYGTLITRIINLVMTSNAPALKLPLELLKVTLLRFIDISQLGRQH